jgi:hypothetical protein
MSRDLVKVRALRPHDTSAGPRAPGEEYYRTSLEAAQLEAVGLVAIVQAKPDVKRVTRAK